MDLKLIEPLRELFKDEVRAVVKNRYSFRTSWRQPFQVLVWQSVFSAKLLKRNLEITREADAIFRVEIAKLVGKENLAIFCLLPNIRSVGVMGDGRTYSHAMH
jgi:GMP synthase (glutamine-hydrolysing)